MRTEGVYTYLCSKCEVFFAVVSRFSVAADFAEVLQCPRCGSNSQVNGEGSISHQTYESKKVIEELETNQALSDGYPNLLTAEHISEILGVSKRVAYEIMERKGFPLIRLGRLKKAKRDLFFQWLENESY